MGAGQSVNYTTATDRVNAGIDQVHSGLTRAQGAIDGAANAIDGAKKVVAYIRGAQGSGGLPEQQAYVPKQPPPYSALVGTTGSGELRGGCECRGGFFGGASKEDPVKDLRAYEDSLSSSAKEYAIRTLAKALNRIGIITDPDASLEVITKTLVDQLPDPRKKKSFPADRDKQEKICKLVATALNDAFTPGASTASDKFIDETLGAEAVCQNVAEWAESFAIGVNMEFITVHASVRNALKAIEVLDQVMVEIFGKIQAALEKSDDYALTNKFNPLTEVYARAQQESKRQKMLLSNILHIKLAPAAEALAIAMRDDSEQHEIIKKLGIKPGTSEFADSLAMSISSLGTAASIAARVHKALKLVGVSVNDYLNSADYNAFSNVLDKIVSSGSIKADDLAKFLAAAYLLKSAFGERNVPEFKEALESTTGGDAAVKTPIGKRIARDAAEKKIIIRDFATRLSRHYDELLASVKSMSNKLGKDIPLTDKTDALRDALARLSDMRNESARLEYALIGRYIDADARERKERFVNALRVASRACETIMELEIYQKSSSYFARLKAAIDAIEKTIDYFADVVTKKFGGDLSGDLSDGTDAAVGGAENDSLLPEIARSGLSLNEAVDEFAYFYYVAKVRVNLEQTSEELEAYGEKYVELLGDAVASRLYIVEQERQAILGRLVPKAAVPGVWPGWLPDLATPITDDKFKSLAAVKKWVNDEYDTKAKFYRVLQAMDLYMKAFTAAIAKDPESVRDIKKMLDGTQVIARWFSEQTGEFMWKAFENMGSVDAAAPAAIAPATTGAAVLLDDTPNTHYYDKVSAAATIVANPNKVTFGIPIVGIQPSGLKADASAAAKKAVSDTYDYFQALKNLINAFARIGDKFSGGELRTQVFMSPAQMFKTLTEFLKQSALSVNAGSTTVVPAALQSTAGGLLGAAGIDVVDIYEVFFDSIGMPRGSRYKEENTYFALIVKAMGAKILTTVGVYDMFERTTPLYSLTPTRMIIGGAPDDDPTVLDKAAELYFRLPRLAEFYREFLRWGDAATDALPFKIAMLPELDGTFSGLVRLIFQKAASPETGDYSDSELRTMIVEINKIYEFYNSKSPDQVCRTVLAAFVIEVNRRYGVIKQKDMKDYWDMVKLARTGQSESQVNDTNYAILPEEGDDADFDRRAPSDRFTVGPHSRFDATTGRPIDPSTGAPYEPFSKDRVAFDDGKRMLRKFREQLDEQFASAQDAFGTKRYSLLIQQAESEIRQTSDRSGKLKVAFRLIQGSNIVGTETNKALMFHETVVVGLNMLSSIETLIRQYSDAIDVMNPITIESAIMDAMYMNSVERVLNTDGSTTAAVGFAPMAADKPGLLALIQTRLPQYDADAVATNKGRNLHDGGAAQISWFDRYICMHDAFNAGRCGLADDIPFTDFLTAMNTARAMHNAVLDMAAAHVLTAHGGLGNSDTSIRPSQFIHPDPANGMTDSVTMMDKNGQTAAYIIRAWVATPTLDIDPAAIDGAIDAVLNFMKVMRMSARMMTNYQRIMTDFVEFTFDLSTKSDGLVEVRFTQGPAPGIQLGFSKLRGLVESILTDVKFYFEQFRPYLTKETIKRFEDKGSPGSIYWLEQRLVDTRIRGVPDDTSPDTFDGISRRANLVLQGLIRKTQVSTRGLTHALLTGGAGALIAAMDAAMALPQHDSLQEWYGQAFSELIFYNATGNAPLHLATDAAGNFASGTNINLRPSNDSIMIQAFIAIEMLNNPVAPGATPANTGVHYAAVATRVETLFTNVPGTYTGVAGSPAALVAAEVVRGGASRETIMAVVTAAAAAQAKTAISTGINNSISYQLWGLVATARTITSGGTSTKQSPITVSGYPVTQFNGLYDTADNGFTSSRSMLFAFNQILALYLSTSIDTAGGFKIYTQLINAIANGALSRSVTIPSGNSFPDIAQIGENFGMRGDPKPSAILAMSLAYIFQRLTKNVNPATQVSDHMVSTLIDIPLYMKESYRVNLPGFIKLFDLLSQKGDFIKQLIQKVPINLTRPSQVTLAELANGVPLGVPHVKILERRAAGVVVGVRIDTAIQYTQNALTALEEFKPQQTSDQFKSSVVAIIDAITSACYTVSNSASEVLKELGDSPAYFQTQEGSIETYKMRYTKMPLMPISLALWFLGDVPHTVRDTSSYADLKILPNKTLGSPQFKIFYGHRQLLARSTPVSYEQLPGVKNIVDTYNGVTPPREQIDVDRYLSFCKNVVAALRYVVDTRNYKSTLTTTNRLQIGTYDANVVNQVSIIGETINASNGLVNYTPARVVGGVPIAATGSVVYGLSGGVVIPPGGAAHTLVPGQDENVILSVVESSNQDDELEKISMQAGAFGVDAATNTRKMERIYNIIDMNIIPINVHALMRDIPLANLYNYEFTFEQMVCSMFNEQLSTLPAPSTRTRHAFIKLLMDPYMEVNNDLYGGDMTTLGSAGYVQRIFRGDNDLGMGRPKFLSDQMFNKALFGSIYQAREDFDEAGPVAGIGAARSRLGATPRTAAFHKFTRIHSIFTNAIQIAGVPANATIMDISRALTTGDPVVNALRTNYSNAEDQLHGPMRPLPNIIVELRQLFGLNDVATQTHAMYKLVKLFNVLIVEATRIKRTFATVANVLAANSTLDVYRLLAEAINSRAIATGDVTEPLFVQLKIVLTAWVAANVGNLAIVAANAAIIVAADIVIAAEAVIVALGGGNHLAAAPVGNLNGMDYFMNISNILRTDIAALLSVYNCCKIIISILRKNMVLGIVPPADQAVIALIIAMDVEIDMNFVESRAFIMRMNVFENVGDDDADFANNVARLTNTAAGGPVNGAPAAAANLSVQIEIIEGRRVPAAAAIAAAVGAADAAGASTAYSLYQLEAIANLVIGIISSGVQLAPAARNADILVRANIAVFTYLVRSTEAFSIRTLFNALVTDTTANGLSQWVIDAAPIGPLGELIGVKNYLTYLKSGEAANSIMPVTLPDGVSKNLAVIGKLRFDTYFVRNIFFVTNVLRVVRQKLNRELTQSRNVLVSSHAAVASGLTEYGADPFMPNEVYDSQLGDEPRWADQRRN